MGAGVLVVAAPNERGLAALLDRLNEGLFGPPAGPLPLEGKKLHAHTDWRADYA